MTSSHSSDGTPDSHQQVSDSQRDIFPIQSLQPEILSRIFTFCLDNRPGVSMKVTRTLCNVCSFWRSLAIATHPLWTQFYVSVFDRTLHRLGITQLVEYIHTWLGRSGTYPVTVHFDYYDHNDEARVHLVQAFGAIAKYASRLETIEIESDISPGSWPVDAPLLRTLSVDYSLEGIPFTSAPQLTKLISSVGLRHSLSDVTNMPWHQLTDVNFNGWTEGNKILDVMQYCTRLESLHANVSNSEEHVTLPYNPPIEHAILKDLTLIFIDKCDGFLSSLILPTLSVFYLHNWGRWAELELVELLKKSHCELAHLYLDNCDLTSHEILKFLEQKSCQTLTNLTITNSDYLIMLIDDEVIRRLTFVDGDSGIKTTPLCPNLVQLTLETCSLKPLSPGVLGRMILSRCSKGRPLSVFDLTTSVTHLEEMALEDHTLLKLAEKNGLQFQYTVDFEYD